MVGNVGVGIIKFANVLPALANGGHRERWQMATVALYFRIVTRLGDADF